MANHSAQEAKTVDAAKYINVEADLGAMMIEGIKTGKWYPQALIAAVDGRAHSWRSRGMDWMAGHFGGARVEDAEMITRAKPADEAEQVSVLALGDLVPTRRNTPRSRGSRRCAWRPRKEA